MSFWSDASPIVKGAIVFGVVGAIAGVLLLTGVIGGRDVPLDEDGNPITEQSTRGLGQE